MAKQEYRMHGFIDKSSLRVGERVTFTDDRGRLVQTSPITYVEYSGNNVYLETANGIYRNYDVEKVRQQEVDRSLYRQGIVEPPKHDAIDEKQKIKSFAERVVETGKSPFRLLDYDFNTLQIYTNGQYYPLTHRSAYEAIEQGSADLIMQCKIQDMRSGQITENTYQLNGVTKFDIEPKGFLEIESSDFLFTTLDAREKVLEYDAMKHSWDTARMWAERCEQNNKVSNIINEYDINELMVCKKNGNVFFGQQALDLLEKGDRVEINTSIYNPSTGKQSKGRLAIPSLQDFHVGKDGTLMLESRSSMFCNTYGIENARHAIQQEREQDGQQHNFRR